MWENIHKSEVNVRTVLLFYLVGLCVFVVANLQLYPSGGCHHRYISDLSIKC